MASYTKNSAVPLLTGSILPYLTPFFSLNMSILPFSGSKRSVPPLFPQQPWCLSDIHFAILLSQRTSAQEVGASPAGAHSFACLSFNWIVSQDIPSRFVLSQKNGDLLRIADSRNFLLAWNYFWTWVEKGILSKGFHNWTGLWGPHLDTLKKQNICIHLLGRTFPLNWLNYTKLTLNLSRWSKLVWLVWITWHSSLWPLLLMKLRSNVCNLECDLLC